MMRLITADDCKPGEPVFARNSAWCARCCAGVSRSEMAKSLGLQVKDIKDIEEGRATPAREIVERMAALTEFPIGHFYRVPDIEDGWLEMPTS